MGGGVRTLDDASALLRAGADKVTILYRRTRVEMPATEHEVTDAEAEGVRLNFLKAPAEVIGKNGRVTALRCVTMELGEPDDSGRRRPLAIEGDVYDMEADSVIMAVSQQPD